MTNISTQEQAKELDQKYVMHTYGRLPITIIKGEGCWAYDINGKKYLDFVAGIAVNGLGHCPPKVVAAICKQASVLIHASNLYHTIPQIQLAEIICNISGMDRAFFCNSGAEANEAAIKLARKAGKSTGSSNKIGIITAHKSFHGRTFGAITATGQAKYQKSFLPLVPGFEYVDYNSVSQLESVMNDNICAVMLEPVQGESGVHAASQEFLAAARKLCDKYNAALIFDEVQTGLGRTGKLFGFQHFGIKPDILTLAKMLGGGFPIGSCLAMGKYAEVFEPGDHASTFGGNPLASAAAIAAVNQIVEDKLSENAEKVGAYFRHRLAELPEVKEIRGKGLMTAVEFNIPIAKDINQKAMENGLLINAIGDNILRFVPPLIITEAEIDTALDILKMCC